MKGAQRPVSDVVVGGPHGRPAPVPCRARSKRTGKPCGQFAVPGLAVCWWHGGATPTALAAARRRLALAEVGQLLGVPREVDPGTALLEAVYLAAGDVETLRLQLPDPEAVVKWAPGGDGVDVRVRLYQEALDRMARLSKLAIDAGIAERVVRIKEAEAAVMAAGFVFLIDHEQLSLSHQQRGLARRLVRDWLLLRARSEPTLLPPAGPS